MANDIKFDFQNEVLDDILFGEEVDVSSNNTDVILEDEKEVEKLKEIEEPEKELEALNQIDEVPSNKKETDSKIDFDDEQEEENSKIENIKLSAIKAVLSKKLERYDISASVDIESLNEEELIDFEEELDRAILDSKYNSYKSVDNNVKSILDYIENGGDPKKITKLFEEQQAVAKIDTSTENGKIKLIKSYYKDVHNWDEDKVVKKLERLKVTNTVEDEFDDVEENYNKHFSEKIEKESQQQEQRALDLQQREIRKQQIFEGQLNKSIQDKKLQKDMRYVAFGRGSLDGEEISILDYKIMEMQSNPEKYIKLIHFLTDSDNYDINIKQEKLNKEVVDNSKKGFQFEPKKIKPDNAYVKDKKSNIEFNFKV